MDPDEFDISPYGSPTRSPKVPRLSLDPEISDDDEDDDGEDDKGKKTGAAVAPVY